jgi:uncharacterized protein (TIGR02996 family)
MSVSISLLQLISTPGTQALWPERFRGLMAKLEENPDEIAQWKVIADWLQENDEPELEDAIRWFVRHEEVEADRDNYGSWYFDRVPDQVMAGDKPPGDSKTLAGALAILWLRIKRAREAAA